MFEKREPRPMTERRTLIVRLWSERGNTSSSDATWRGEVEEIGCNKPKHFKTLEDGIAYLNHIFSALHRKP
jgi:hypothetical protein